MPRTVRRNSLTDAAVRSLSRKVRDGLVPKVEARLADGGNLFFEEGRYWRYRYEATVAGRRTPKVLAFGRYPEVSLRRARELRDEAAGLRARGIDPADARREARAAAERERRERSLTFEAVAREWHEKRNARGARTEKYRREVWGMVGNHLLPHIGDIPVALLSRDDLTRALERLGGLADRGRRVCQICCRICRYARNMGYVGRDISSGLVETLPTRPPVVHRPCITNPAGLGRLLRRIDAYGGHPSTCFALKIAPHVFLRPQELVSSEWADIDFDRGLWIIPARRMKTRRGHVVPLSSQVTALLKELRATVGGERYLFPSPADGSRHLVIESLRKALTKGLGYDTKELSTHGFRGTASTLLNDAGFDADVIEKQLAHGDRDRVRAAYNRAEYLDRRREMMQWWSDCLDGLKARAAEREEGASGPAGRRPGAERSGRP